MPVVGLRGVKCFLIVVLLIAIGLQARAGSGFAPRVTLTLGEVHYAKAADIDGDGDVDIVAANDYRDGIIHWWENVLADGSEWERRDIGTHFGRPFVVLDTDGDRDPDVVHYGAGSELYQFVNTDGRGGAWRKQPMELEFGIVNSMGVGDVDGDGRPDFVATEDDDMAWFGRWDDGLQRHAIETNHQDIFTTDPVDLDGDQDLDMLGWSESGAAFWYENQDLNWIRHRLEVFDHVEGNLGAGDLDGDPDLIGVAANPLGLIWLENVQGDASAWEPHRFEATFKLIAGLEDADYYSVADLDHDGDQDVAVGSFASCLVAWLENVDEGETWAGHVIDRLEEPTLMITVDVTGDGFHDMVGASREGEGLACWSNVSALVAEVGGGRPVVTEIEPVGVGALRLAWTSIPGAHYRVDFSSDFRSWVELEAPSDFGFFTGAFVTEAVVTLENPGERGYLRVVEQ